MNNQEWPFNFPPRTNPYNPDNNPAFGAHITSATIPFAAPPAFGAHLAAANPFGAPPAAGTQPPAENIIRELVLKLHTEQFNNNDLREENEQLNKKIQEQEAIINYINKIMSNEVNRIMTNSSDISSNVLSNVSTSNLSILNDINEYTDLQEDNI